MLHYTRRLIALRRETAALQHGRYRLLDAEHPALWLYERLDASTSWVIALNFSATAQALPAPLTTMRRVLANVRNPSADTLAAWEARILVPA